jgi:hypothetical protein
VKAGGAFVGIPIVMFPRGGMPVPVSKGGGPVGVTVAAVGSVEDDLLVVDDELGREEGEVEGGPGGGGGGGFEGGGGGGEGGGGFGGAGEDGGGVLGLGGGVEILCRLCRTRLWLCTALTSTTCNTETKTNVKNLMTNNNQQSKGGERAQSAK